jgi:predicted NBD/HSP70 family sugar kinase
MKANSFIFFKKSFRKSRLFHSFAEFFYITFKKFLLIFRRLSSFTKTPNYRKVKMKKVINQELMRATNKKQILEFIQKNAPLSKKEIADRLGLSTTSVSTFINELISEDKIMNCGIAKSTGGRKSSLYQLNPEALYTIGLDLQVDRIIAVLLNFNGDLIETIQVPFKNKEELYLISLLKAAIDQISAARKINPQKIRGVGIGIPGIVDHSAGLVEFAPNLGWKNVNLRQLLGINQPIYVENEANAAALGEKAYGVARNITNLVYISVGMGVGCGLILNNRLFTGHSYHAGEFGHMTVEPDGLLCQCGNRGCWEVYSSNDAALKLYAQKSGVHLNYFEEFLELVQKNDLHAAEVLESIIDYLGLGIANIANGINPEMIVVGGKIAEIRSLIYNKLSKQIKDRCLEKSFGKLVLEFSQLKDSASALGVASLVIDEIMESDL